MHKLKQILEPSTQRLASIHPTIVEQYQSFIEITVQRHPFTEDQLRLLDSAVCALSANLQVHAIYNANPSSATQYLIDGMQTFYDCVNEHLTHNIAGINAILKHPMYSHSLTPIIMQMRRAQMSEHIDAVCEKPESAARITDFLIYLKNSPHQHIITTKMIALLVKNASHIDNIRHEINKLPHISQSDFEKMIKRLQQADVTVSNKSAGFFAQRVTVLPSEDTPTLTNKKGPA